MWAKCRGWIHGNSADRVAVYSAPWAGMYPSRHADTDREGMKTTQILILGAGPTGLGSALRLQEEGNSDWMLYDREHTPGGLASSVTDEHGFTWDMGGHVQFSHYESFDRYMDLALGADGWLNHQRESWVWIADRFVPYPFQNNL